MNLIKCLFKPIIDALRHSAEETSQPAQECNSQLNTPFDASTNHLIPTKPSTPHPSTPHISIRTAPATASTIDETDRHLAPNALSPAQSSDPWHDRSSGRHSPNLPRSRTSSHNSFEKDSLGEQIRSARNECPQRLHHFMVPNSALESLITVPNVEKDIQAKCIDIAEVKDVAGTACQTAKKLFAILAYMKLGSEICSLLRDGVSDKDLPLTRRRNDNGEYLLERKSGVPINTFAKWNDKDIEEFDRIQWWMLAPVFEDKEHYELDDNMILPFIPFKTNAETEQKKEGGYSEVFAVRCHPAHHTFWPRSVLEEDEPLIAVKKLYSSEKKEFEKEVTILKALGSKKNKHPHLIKLLATYRQERKYHLLFPYADANLRTYWDNRPSPIFDEATVLWSLKQMAGIASALELIHNFSVTVPLSVDGPGNIRMPDDARLSVEKSEELFGRHGDIKPENILWFQECPETDDKMGILQIADFGLGRFHGRDSRSKVPPDSVLGSPTYEPPECKLHRPVSRAYDIWSLGCLYLEFITWLLKGSAEIEGFSDFRGRSGSRSKGLNDDYFFTIIRISNVESDAVVRGEVIEWVNQLHQHEKCSALIHDLLDLIMKDVLLTDASKRIDARWLKHKLNSCLNKAKSDKIYLLRPVPREPKLSSEARSKSTSTVLDVPQTSSRKVTFVRQDRPLPLTPAHYRPPRDLVQRGPATPGLSRSRTHSTWPTSGPSNG